VAVADFHLMVKPAGAVRNLDCKYCYYLSKKSLYPGSGFRMEEDLLENYIRQLMQCEPSYEVTVAWQGGEHTLMGLDCQRGAWSAAGRTMLHESRVHKKYI
jgi:uncharacterized protein